MDVDPHLLALTKKLLEELDKQRGALEADMKSHNRAELRFQKRMQAEVADFNAKFERLRDGIGQFMVEFRSRFPPGAPVFRLEELQELLDAQPPRGVLIDETDHALRPQTITMGGPPATPAE